MNIIKTEMLMIANNLESKADDAHMEHDDVRMTPSEVHELADDIKAFVRESDRPTCQMKSVQTSSYRVCSRCGAFVRKDAVTDCTEIIPVRFCPNCGAVVTEKEEDNG